MRPNFIQAEAIRQILLPLYCHYNRPPLIPRAALPPESRLGGCPLPRKIHTGAASRTSLLVKGHKSTPVLLVRLAQKAPKMIHLRNNYEIYMNYL